MFEANGWNVIDAKYGKKLEDVFNLPNGELMKDAIDDMPNELYQRLLRKSEALREWLPKSVKDSLSMEKSVTTRFGGVTFNVGKDIGSGSRCCPENSSTLKKKFLSPLSILSFA